MPSQSIYRRKLLLSCRVPVSLRSSCSTLFSHNPRLSIASAGNLSCVRACVRACVCQSRSEKSCNSALPKCTRNCYYWAAAATKLKESNFSLFLSPLVGMPQFCAWIIDRSNHILQLRMVDFNVHFLISAFNFHSTSRFERQPKRKLRI